MRSALRLGVVEAALGELVDEGWSAAFGGDDAEALDEPEVGRAGECALDVAVVRAVGPEQAADLRGEQEPRLVEGGEDELAAAVDAGERGVVGERADRFVLQRP